MPPGRSNGGRGRLVQYLDSWGTGGRTQEIGSNLMATLEVRLPLAEPRQIAFRDCDEFWIKLLRERLQLLHPQLQVVGFISHSNKFLIEGLENVAGRRHNRAQLFETVTKGGIDDLVKLTIFNQRLAGRVE
uniref:Uncharacterized protein n=1 Tax=Cacopsylla melanoneura TaxID=428564 RepID=A0A8D8TA63_9HEMI